MLAAADSGTARVAGFDVHAHAVEVQRRISLTGQSAAVDDGLTATQNVVMFGRLAGLSRSAARAKGAELLARFDLTEAAGRRVRTFSGGMRRRLDLALSFVVTPQVLFLDEPTTGLDTRARRELWGTIRSLAAAGTTVFLTTQYLEEADQLADRIAVLHDGRIAALGTPDELKAQVGSDRLELRDAHGELVERIATDGSLAGLRRALDELESRTRCPQGAEMPGDAELSGSAGMSGVTLSLGRPSLDDVFLELTERPATQRHGISPATHKIEENS